jgi:hypothetical protein
VRLSSRDGKRAAGMTVGTGRFRVEERGLLPG